MLNDAVYVPLFGIPQDAVALEQWQAAFPAHSVKGSTFLLDDEPAVPASASSIYPDGRGWQNFDALHCRTRAVWDPHMLHVAAQTRDRSAAPPGEGVVVEATIVPYGAEGLVADSLQVRWRVAGTTDWREEALTRGDDGLFRATMPASPAGAPIEYFVTATDTDGRTATAPRFAPEAVRVLRRVDAP